MVLLLSALALMPQPLQAQEKASAPWGWGRDWDMYDLRGEPHALVGIARNDALSPTAGNLRKVALGRHHALFLRHDGSVLAWGANCYGELGAPVIDTGTDCYHHAPVEVPLPTKAFEVSLPTRALDVACGPHYSVFLLDDGRLLACGRNDESCLGRSFPPQTDALTPVEGREAVGEIAAIWAGVRGLAAIDAEDHRVWWIDRGQATRVADLPGGVVKIAGVMGLGDNEGGYLDHSSPGMASRAAVRLASNNACPDAGRTGPSLAGAAWRSPDIAYLLADGRLVLEGARLASLVLGSDAWRTELPLPGRCQDVALGEDFLVCLMRDGTVRAAGQNDRCQLGVGTAPAFSRALLRVEGLSNVVAVAANKDVAFAVRTDGSVWGWGTSGFLLGVNEDRTRCRPAPIAGISGAARVEVGPNLALALPYAAELVVWSAAVEYDGQAWAPGAKEPGDDARFVGLSPGTRLTVRALFPRPGFKEWKVFLEGMSLEAFKHQCLTSPSALEQSEFTFTMPAARVDIAAEYSWYDVSVSDAWPRDADGMIRTRFIPGEIVEVVPPDEICRDTPCRFVRWEGNVENWQIGPATPCARFVMPAHDVTLQPLVESTVPGFYYLTVFPGKGSGSYAPGESVRIVADEPSPDSRFSGWTGSGGVVIHEGEGLETTVTMPDRDATVTARYAPAVFQETQVAGAPPSLASPRRPTVSGGAPEAGWRVFLHELPFAFPFCGRTVRRVWASSDGYLDLTENGTFAHSVVSPEARMTTGAIARNAMIAPFAASLDATSLDLRLESRPRWVRFIWSGQAAGGGPVSFEAILCDDGRVQFNYGAGNRVPGARVALSAGDGNRYHLSATHDRAASLDHAASVRFTPRSMDGWTLTVENGTGTGRYAAGQLVELRAYAPPAGLSFDRWIGDTAGLDTLDEAVALFTMPARDTRLIASFRATGPAESVRLTVRFEGGGSGTVTLQPSGQRCHGACTVEVSPGGTLTLEADPAAGSVFERWQGGCAGTRCELVPLSDCEVVARFVPESVRCLPALDPAGRSHRAEGGEGAIQVQVAAACSWSAASQAGWITLKGGAAGEGPGTVTYTVAAHAGAQERMGTILVASRPFLVQQSGVESCGVAVLPSNRSHGSGETAGAIEVYAPPPCTWEAATLTSWIHLGGDLRGTGAGAVNYQLEANPGTACRSGSIVIEHHVVEIHQAAPTGTRGWVSLGPAEAGIESLVVDPLHANVLYAGTDDGMIFKTTTSGAAWMRLDPGLEAYDSVNALAVNPRDGNVVFAATLARGVLRSLTGGDGWSPLNAGLPHTRIEALLLCPEQPDWLYALPSAEGVWRTVNGGESWTARNETLGSTATFCVETFRPDGLRVLAGGPFGIYRSLDGGASWQQVASQTPCLSLRFHPWDPNLAYAGCAGGGVQRSTDGGATWQPTGPGLPARDTVDLLIHPAHPNLVFAATDYGVFRTLDAGVSWHEYNTALPAGRSRWIRALAMTRQSPFALYAGAGGYPGMGVFVYRESEGEGQDCAATLAPELQTFPHTGGSGSVTVHLGPDCCWTAALGATSWITPTSPAMGQGTATLAFTVAPNQGPSRASTVTIGGSVATVIQAANPGLPPAPIIAAQTGTVGLTLRWEVVPGLTYRVEYTDKLGSDDWIGLPGDLPARGSVAVKIDPTLAGIGERYYRVRVVP